MEFSVMMGILMEGFALTAEIFLITLVGSLPLGVWSLWRVLVS